MSNGQQQPDNGKIDKQYAFALLYVIANAHRMMLAVFLRHSFGIRAHEPHGIIAFFVLLVLAGTGRVFLIYFWLWIVTLAGQRIYSFRLRFKGVKQHSRYQGYPWLAMRLPSINSEAEARKVEPFICLLLGLLLVTICEPLGYFVAAGFVSLTVSMGIDWIVEKQRLMTMNDGELEMRYYAEKFRG